MIEVNILIIFTIFLIHSGKFRLVQKLWSISSVYHGNYGRAVFGFLYKEVFLNFEPTKSPNINIELAKHYASISIFFFGVTSASALAFRYCSSEGLRVYIEGLRYVQAGMICKGQRKLKCERKLFLVLCIVSKFVSALSLAIGAVMTALTFLELLK